MRATRNRNPNPDVAHSLIESGEAITIRTPRMEATVSRCSVARCVYPCQSVFHPWLVSDRAFLCVLCVSVVQFGTVTVNERDSPQRRRAHREDINQQKVAKTRKDPDSALPCALRSFAIFCNSPPTDVLTHRPPTRWLPATDAPTPSVLSRLEAGAPGAPGAPVPDLRCSIPHLRTPIFELLWSVYRRTDAPATG